MPEPQPVLTPLTANAIFLVLTIDPGGEDTVRDFLSDWTSVARAVGFRAPDAPIAAVAAIGARAWDRLFGGPRPAELHPFAELAGSVHRAVSTAGDLLFHLRHERMDVCFEFASQALTRLAGAATVVDEVHGFRYFDERDLMGFVDGTENPAGRAAGVAALVGQADPGFAGGSYVIVQKYLHDLTAWNALSTEDQEKAIGRYKLSDIEMPDDVKPAELTRRPEHHRGARRHTAADPAGQHAVRGGGARGIRHVLHRLRGDAERDGADAQPHVHRRSAGQHRPHP